MTTVPVNMDAVALAVADVLKVLDPEPVIREASVSGVFTTPKRPARAGVVFWRCCVAINGTHVFQPRFSCVEDAEAYREAVTVALDRAC